MCESRSPCSIGIIFFEGFFEGHKFISFFTVTCLPSLNKGVTLPYLYATPRHGASSNGFYPNLAGFSLPNFAVNALRVALIFTRVLRQNSCFKHETPFFTYPSLFLLLLRLLSWDDCKDWRIHHQLCRWVQPIRNDIQINMSSHNWSQINSGKLKQLVQATFSLKQVLPLKTKHFVRHKISRNGPHQRRQSVLNMGWGYAYAYPYPDFPKCLLRCSLA